MAYKSSTTVFSCLVLLLAFSLPDTAWANNDEEDEELVPTIPPLMSPFGSYPDLLGSSSAATDQFHPIVRFPRRCWNATSFVCPFSDYSKPQPHTAEQLLDETTFATRQQRRLPFLLARFRRWWRTHTPPSWHFSSSMRGYVGRYDEDRVGLYASSALFGEDDNNNNRRTVHVGLDLAGRVGTPVYSCCENGVVVAAGYNAARGDYGHVVVVRHKNNHAASAPPYFFVLYGHLDAASSSDRWENGDVVQRGEIIGWMGNAWENGGWTTPHVHVQISLLEPKTHDMPGAVRLRDREKALRIYLDPRYIVGNVH